MRRLVLPLLFATAATASAQVMPPSISKPIDAARNAANATNQQTSQVTGQAVKPVTKPMAAPPAAPAAPAKTDQKPAAPTAKGGAAPAAPAGKAAAGKAEPAPALKEEKDKITFEREVFSYVASGRRDPFASPIETGQIRPLVSDLRVTGIIYDARGRNSVAVMRDMSTQEQYRVKAGQVLGRARVAQIKPQEVVMAIDEYGITRQEILKLNVQTQQTKGKP